MITINDRKQILIHDTCVKLCYHHLKEFKSLSFDLNLPKTLSMKVHF